MNNFIFSQFHEYISEAAAADILQNSCSQRFCNILNEKWTPAEVCFSVNIANFLTTDFL